MTNPKARGAVPREVTIRGVRYRTVREAAAAFDVHPGTLSRRLRDGWDIEEAIGFKRHVKKMPGRSLVHAGKRYPSIKALAEAVGVQAGTLQARLAKGRSVHEAVEFAPRRAGNRKAVRFKGRIYSSGKALAERHGLTWSVVSRRVLRGWTMAQALGVDPVPPRFRNFAGHARKQHWKKVQVIDGRKLPKANAGEYRLYVITNVRNAKEYVGITTNALDARLRGHFAMARRGRRSHLCNAMRRYGRNAFRIELVRNDAADFAELQRQEVAEIARRDSIRKGYNSGLGGSLGTSKEVRVGDQVFPSRNAAATHFGLDVGVFNLRLNRLGWSPEEAAEIQPRDKFVQRKVKIGRKIYPSLKSAAEARGLDYKLVHDRIRAKDWTERQALELDPPPETAIYRGRAIRLRGRQFASIAKGAKAFGIDPDALSDRIRKGDTPDEALSRCVDVRDGKATYHARRSAR